MATVLVTGGAGYVGSHACKALAAAGHVPVVYDNLSTGWRAAVRFGPFVEGDLRDGDALATAFADHRPDAVLHFAALSTVGESAQFPDVYWSNNIGGSASLFQAARIAGVDAIVFSSTCAIFGDADGDVLTEDSPKAPLSVYGRNKLVVEEMLADQEAAFGTRSVAFRYFNAAGADPDGEIGEDHRPETHLIPIALDAALGDRPNVTVFGRDYATSDGTCIRDYVHVMDLAEAHVRGVEWLLEGGRSLALNLGSGQGHSVQKVLETAQQVTGHTISIVEGDRREGDAMRLVSGSVQAQEILGWQPRRVRLDETIADAWRWHRSGRYGP
ncbi:MAG: UDP-glucose 4-epimerase GalE [Pseudomonadota bacterium]